MGRRQPRLIHQQHDENLTASLLGISEAHPAAKSSAPFTFGHGVWWDSRRESRRQEMSSPPLGRTDRKDGTGRHNRLRPVKTAMHACPPYGFRQESPRLRTPLPA